MTSPAVARAKRQRADQVRDQLGEIPRNRIFKADVTTVTAGAGLGGTALVTVTWRGRERTVNDYPDSYTPAEGHRVRCVLDEDNELAILHRCVGQPI